MKKIVIFIVILLVLSGCSKSKNAFDIVKDYLDNYNSLSSNIRKEIDEIVNNSNELSEDNKDIYKKIFLRQYKDLKYTILTEEYGDNKALITVNINVYDLNKAEEEAMDYLSKNLKDFYDDNDIFNNDKYINYKLNLMYESKERIDYIVTFLLELKNDKWVLVQPTNEDLEKIHGIYKLEE